MGNEVIELLKEWSQQTNKHIEKVSNYLKNSSSISNEYCKSKEDVQKDMFNVFYLISDLYYRENFHSDIISFFLDTQQKHGAGNAFLEAFIQMLNRKGKSIDPYYYRDAVAIREKEDRIDILIKSESTKKAIIIENKINNAGDRYRQIPRYYDYVTQNQFIVDAIVYIPLDIRKEPDKGDWSNEDKEKINPLLVVIPAYDKYEKINLVDGWLRPSILLSDNLDVVSTLRQYSNLITKLNHNIMDTIVLEKFYNELLQGDNMKTALSVRNMLNDLPVFLASRIQAKYNKNCSPFSKIWIYNSKDAVFEKAIINNVYYKMDIWCNEYGYDVCFWHPQDQNDNYSPITENDFSLFIQSIGSLSCFDYIANEGFSYKKHFDFSDEDGLYSFINQLLKELSALV